jgi:outer membrane biosynthesis protein TonB
MLAAYRNSKGLASAGIAVVLLALVLASTGCKKRTVQAAPPVVVTQPSTTPAETPPPPQPETKTEPAPSAPQPPMVPTTKPSSPRVTSRPATTTPAPAPAPAPEPPKVAAPQMSPSLSPGELAEHKNKTNEAIATAEKNLQRAYGRTLNTTQKDLTEKIRGFLGQAREASRANDWIRARNLAEKAQVLSVELVNSL